MKSASFFCAEKRIAGAIGWKLYLICGMIELMAKSLGVGVLYSGFLMGAINRTQEIKDRLKIKENQHLAAVMLMGVPDVKYQRTAPRKKANIIWE